MATNRWDPTHCNKGMAAEVSQGNDPELTPAPTCAPTHISAQTAQTSKNLDNTLAPLVMCVFVAPMLAAMLAKNSAPPPSPFRPLDKGLTEESNSATRPSARQRGVDVRPRRPTRHRTQNENRTSRLVCESHSAIAGKTPQTNGPYAICPNMPTQLGATPTQRRRRSSRQGGRLSNNHLVCPPFASMG